MLSIVVFKSNVLSRRIDSALASQRKSLYPRFCSLNISAYIGQLTKSSSCVSQPMISPCENTAILSAIVEEASRCETNIVVLFLAISKYRSYISLSAIGSSEAVGSSRISIGVFCELREVSRAFVPRRPKAPRPTLHRRAPHMCLTHPAARRSIHQIRVFR